MDRYKVLVTRYVEESTTAVVLAKNKTEAIREARKVIDASPHSSRWEVSFVTKTKSGEVIGKEPGI